MLLTGASGSGKTRFIFSLCEEICSTRTFLKRKAKPDLRIGYHCYDRTLEDAWDTLIDMKMDLEPYGIQLVSHLSTDEEALQAKDLKDIDIIILDGIDMLVDNVNSFKDVRTMMKNLLRYIDKRDVAIIGIMGEGKQKPGEGYANSRERAIGSSAWGRLASCGLNISVNATGVRQIELDPRMGGGKEMSEWIFDERNRLVPFMDEGYVAPETKILRILPNDFTTSQAVEAATKLAISESFVKKLLSDLFAGQIARLAHGQYRKIKPS